MTREETIIEMQRMKKAYCNTHTDAQLKKDSKIIDALDMGIKALKQKPIDKSAMMYEIYMEGVNMSGEYQGCWVRFKDIEKIVDKYIGDTEVKASK